MQLGAGERGGQDDEGDGDDRGADARRDPPPADLAATVSVDEAAPADPAAPIVGADDPTRTSAPHDDDDATAPPADRDDRLPAPLQYRDPDRYAILGEHGRGGLGRVLRARDKELGRQVAVKELLRRGATSELRFFREALITARLEHPGIVPVHEAGRWPDGTPFYAMKLVQGRPLRELVDECATPADRLTLLPHVVAVADAIAYAHDRKIIHRDLKPSNVIVGAFGETVVIDWGLAKDLTDEIADPVDDGPYRTPAASGLTVAGSVLGTPAYMAPEQRDGHADERADIYAIGGILYHLLAGQPPHLDGTSSAAVRPLPRAVPRDLAAIVTRAMAPDPAARYASAADLGADLRRFTQRRPVAARRYSLAGRALLGFARHRAASVVLVAALTAIIVLLAVDNHRVDGQRQRAVAAQTQATAAQRAAETAVDKLTLKNAQLLLAKDPSAALDALATYRGDDRDAAEQLRAEAIGRGVAILRAKPQTGNVLWMRGLPGGAVISLSNDGTLVRTSLAGVTTVIDKYVAESSDRGYLARGHLLAYACVADQLCIYDTLAGGRGTAIERVAMPKITGMTVSSDGAHLAVAGRSGALTIFDVDQSGRLRAMVHRIVRGELYDITDAGDVIYEDASGLEIQGDEGSVAVARDVPGRIWNTAARRRLVAVGTTNGVGALVDASTGRTTSSLRLCTDKVAWVLLVPGRSDPMYVCKNGAVGEWNVGARKATVLFHVSGAPTVGAASPSGRYVIVGTYEGNVSVYDFAAGTSSTYRGHGLPITSIAVPTPDWPFVGSGDSGGSIRIWPVPLLLARVVARPLFPFFQVSFGPDPTELLGTTYGVPELHAIGADGAQRELRPHDGGRMYVTRSPDGRLLAAYGMDSKIEIWSTAPVARVRTLDAGVESVAQVLFVGPERLVSAGEDGRLILWRSDGASKVLGRFAAPIERFVWLSRGTLVLENTDGSLWRVTLAGKATPIGRPHGDPSRIVASADESVVLVGYESGDVIAIETDRWSSTRVLHASAVVRDIAVDAKGHCVAVSTDDGHVYVSRRAGDAQARYRHWSEVRISTRALSFARNGLLVSANRDGPFWVYSPASLRWLFVTTNAAGFRASAMTPDGRFILAGALDGPILSLDLDAAARYLVDRHDNLGDQS